MRIPSFSSCCLKASILLSQAGLKYQVLALVFRVACRILIPWPVAEPMPLAVELGVLTTGPQGGPDSYVLSGHWRFLILSPGSHYCSLEVGHQSDCCSFAGYLSSSLWLYHFTLVFLVCLRDTHIFYFAFFLKKSWFILANLAILSWDSFLYGWAQSLKLEHTVWVSCSCYNKGPHTGWFKTTEIVCLTVYEARSVKSGCQRTVLPTKLVGEDPSLPFPASSSLRYPLVCGCMILNLLSCLCMAVFFLYLCLTVLLLIGTPVILD